MPSDCPNICLSLGLFRECNINLNVLEDIVCSLGNILLPLSVRLCFFGINACLSVYLQNNPKCLDRF